MATPDSATETPEKSQTFPTPADRPEADIVVYDGQCNMCRRQIQRLNWFDCQGKLAYVSLHDPAVNDLLPEMSHDELMEQMVVIDQQGRRHAGPESIRYFSRRLRRLWWLAPFMHLPGAMIVGRPLYRWIAKNRYRFAGRDACEGGTCHLHQ